MKSTNHEGAEAERAAVKRLVVAINGTLARKNAANRAVQSWRLRYQWWKRRVAQEEAKSGLSEDQLDVLKRLVGKANASLSLDCYNRGQLRVSEEVPEPVTYLSQALEPFAKGPFKGLVDELNAQKEKALKERESLITRWRAYWSQEEAYEDALTTWKAKAAKQRAYRRARAEERQKIFDDAQALLNVHRHDLTAEANTTEISQWGLSVANQAATYHRWPSEWETEITWNDKNPDLSKADDLMEDGDASLEDIAAEIGVAVADFVDREIIARNGLDESIKMPANLKPGPRPKKPHEPEKKQVTAMITVPPITPQELVSATLVSELDDYTQGPYKRSMDAREAVNGLARRIGHNCPELDAGVTEWDPSDLHSAIDDVKASWGLFAKGGAGNSAQGKRVIGAFKAAVHQLESAEGYDDLKRASSVFSSASTALFAWFSSKWYQYGGQPEAMHVAKWRGSKTLARAFS